MFSRTYKTRSTMISTQFDQFAALFVFESEAVNELNDKYIQNVRSENMEENVIIREMRNILLSKKHIFAQYLRNWCNQKKVELSKIQGLHFYHF